MTFRPEIKILDCTIRDGGLMSNHHFEDKAVRAVYFACVKAGLDYMELGYKASKKLFTPSLYGAWKYCDEENIKRIVGENHTGLKLSAMADATRTDYKTDILPKQQSVLDMIRVACYTHQLSTALDMVKDARDKGYETTINIIAISTVTEAELDKSLELAAESGVDTIYLVDSFGNLYNKQIQYLIKKYIKYDRQVGIHAHNNRELAFANTIEACEHGANMLDGSLAGLGRGAGNCRTELIVGFLRHSKYRLRPLLECIQEHIEPLRKHLLWGPDIPYMLTGLYNQHPRSAIQYNAGENRGNYIKFFDDIKGKN
ncbi:aldolase catalytic domain-containing protein [candidate division KSB1 bacterium]|nr:aldolase catalytic domain-containing protein [candidate division KSB1 bacterium]